MLGLVEAELPGVDFIARSQPTIADIALYSYIARAPEGNVDLSGYPNVMAWLATDRSAAGFVAFGKRRSACRLTHDAVGADDQRYGPVRRRTWT